jgi:hypothetical protein
MDILVDTINHNLRKRLDVTLYDQSMLILCRLLSYLTKSRTKLTYHWPELWRSLLAFIRFLTAYADNVKALPGTADLVRHLVDLLTIALTSGEAFLHDSASYDDLVYKLVESGEALTTLKTTFSLDASRIIDTLISVSKHYRELIEEQHKGNAANLSPREVGKIIMKGYETFSVESRQGLEDFEKFRESEWKSVLKRVSKIAVADAAALVA